MCIAVVEFFVECTRCYYIERKICALLAFIGIFLGVFFGLKGSPVGDGMSGSFMLILALIIAFAGANLVYVMTSESFCNFCSGASGMDFGGGSGRNAFQAHGRGRVGV